MSSDASSGSISEMTDVMVRAVAELHAEAFPGTLLAGLGVSGLACIYGAALATGTGFGFTGWLDGRVAGFAFATADTPLLFRAVVRRRGLHLGVRLAWAGLTHPRLLGLVRPTWHYLGQNRGERPRAELLSIAVRSDFRKHGLGSQFVAALHEGFRARGVRRYCVGASLTQAGATSFYERLGLRFQHDFAMGSHRWHRYVADVPPS